jgi:hypothetical protein
MRPDLDPNFSFRVDTDGDILADEPSTINDVVSKEDWYKQVLSIVVVAPAAIWPRKRRTQAS